MDFPQSISFTITNACNLRCQMCGQWSQEGYIRSKPERLKGEMTLTDWKRLVDELADHHISSLLLRGGEPFLFPGIIDLLQYIHSKGLFTAIDTNGTQLKRYAEDIARIGKIHLTISLDGPAEIHDAVRGVKGTFARIRDGIHALNNCERISGNPISKSFNFTICPYSIKGLGALPDAVRSLGLNSVAIVPYYFFPEAVGEAYAQEMQTALDCSAYSWVGFHHESSGVDFELFHSEYEKYLANLKGVTDFPYMAFTEDQYRTWF